MPGPPRQHRHGQRDHDRLVSGYQCRKTCRSTTVPRPSLVTVDPPQRRERSIRQVLEDRPQPLIGERPSIALAPETVVVVAIEAMRVAADHRHTEPGVSAARPSAYGARRAASARRTSPTCQAESDPAPCPFPSRGECRTALPSPIVVPLITAPSDCRPQESVCPGHGRGVATGGVAMRCAGGSPMVNSDATRITTGSGPRLRP